MTEPAEVPTARLPADDPSGQNGIARAILDLTAGRGPGASICPSEAARAVATAADLPDWRPLMTRVRQVAAILAQEGRIDILRKGRPIDPAAMHGVIRLRVRA